MALLLYPRDDYRTLDRKQRVTVTTAPAPILSLAEAKLHLYVDHTDDDDLIEACIAAATATIDGPDGWLGRSIGTQTLEMRQDGVEGEIKLPCGPVASVTSVKYLDVNDVEQTYPSADYSLIGDRVVLKTNKSWPGTSSQPESVRVVYVAGQSTQPMPIIHAIKIMVADMYGARESFVNGTISAEMSSTIRVDWLLANYRLR